ACSVQFGDKDIPLAVAAANTTRAASKSLLEGVRAGREICRTGRAHHIGVAAGIHSKTAADFIAAAPKVGRIDQRRTSRVELGHKSVPHTDGASSIPAKHRLKGSWSGWEVVGYRVSCHIDVAYGIHGNTRAVILSTASQIGR